MDRKFTFLITLAILLSLKLQAQQLTGFNSVINLTPQPTTANSGEKPQSKPWKYNGKWWAVFPNAGGTYLWRLDGNGWTSVLKLSSKTTSKADCKVVGSTTHILLYQGASSQMASVEYDESTGAYKLWSKRTSTVGLTLDKGVETATIDVDSRGRMWLASAGVNEINVRWSDAPYSNWSPPVTIATGVTDDDICAVTALPGKIGVIWSNQNTQRFGFKTHVDGTDPSSWSSDEIPASQSAQNIGNGMADDHMNFAVASDGTLYCAVKTEYATQGYPEIALLVRRPTGTWDNLYGVASKGTRPIVILNEDTGRLKVIYTSSDSGGNILYKESATSNIAFGSQLTLISGTYNNATSSKDNYNPDVVVLASTSSQIVGVLATDGSALSIPSAPELSSPANNAIEIPLSLNLNWNAAEGADSYQVQVSNSSSFTTRVFDRSDITSTSAQISNLSNSTVYYWRVRAINSAGTSAWSATWSFTTADPSTQYTLAVSTVGSGTVSKSPNQTSYASGSSANLTATPAAGYQFSGWSGDAAGTANPLSVTMDGNKSITATFTAAVSQQQVVSFTLINSHNEQDLRTIEDGDIINLSSLPSTKLNIRANTSPAAVGSVKFELSGTQSRIYIDNAIPYALHGDDGMGNYYYGNWNPPATGTYTLKATPYSGSKASGTAGTPLTVTFTFTTSSLASSTASSLQETKLPEDELKAYPNPFSSKANLKFSLATEDVFVITLLDARGAQVAILREGKAQAGVVQVVEVDGSALPKGLYFVKLQTRDKAMSLKLIVNK